MKLKMRMKRLFPVCVSIAIMLSGCAANSTEPVNSSTNGPLSSSSPAPVTPEASPQPEQSIKALTAAEVLGKAMEVSTGLNSFQNQIAVKQTIQDAAQK
jgi:hypothetical protein